MNSFIKIQIVEALEPTKTEKYWGLHNIRPEPFKTKEESLHDIQVIFNTTPFHKEFMDLYGEHKDEIILDYGCGPGRDMVGFLHYSKAEKVIGMDVSIRVLELTNHRLSLHNFDSGRVSLIKLSDATPAIPLWDESVDYIHCSGVLHHTSHPEEIIREFHRILKPGRRACIMVYNRDSIWFQLQIGYVYGILNGELKHKTIEEVWTAHSDGGAPISLTYRPGIFQTLCYGLGFKTVDFVGGYISISEIDIYKRYASEAIANPNTLEEGRNFLKEVRLDSNGFPMYLGKYTGLGGVYVLYK